MERYRELKKGNLITLWDDAEGIGIKFEVNSEGDRVYNLALKDIKLLSKYSMSAKISGIVQRIKTYAEIKYPTARD